MPEHLSSWSFLAASTVGALLTANALRPIHRNRYLATLSFFAGWLTSELPLHHLAVQALGVSAFIVAGALAATPGWIALGLALLSSLGLLLAGRRALDAHGVIDHALHDAFEGASPGVELPDAPPLLEVLAAWRRRILLPTPVADARVERIRDLVYHEACAVRLRLDVFRREGGTGPRPTLMFVHGGAWIIGNKEHQGLPLLHHLAALGWVCVSINYRRSPRFVFPDHLEDVKRAIHWVKTEGQRYGTDPDVLVIAGGSAGGHLASLAALTANDPAWQVGFESADTSVAGCVPFYGVYDMTDEGTYPHDGLVDLLERHVFQRSRESDPGAFERASPIRHVHEGAPPFFIVHGDCDTMVPVEEARRFSAALRAVSRAPVGYAEIPGAQHAFEVFPSLRTALVTDGVARFATWLQRQRLARARASAPAAEG